MIEESSFEKLRNIQINLKRENTFFTFFRTEARELNHQIKILYLGTLYEYKKFGMIHKEAMLNKDITSLPSYVNSFYMVNPTRIPKVPSDIPEDIISKIKLEIDKLSKDNTYLVQCCQRLFQTKDENLLYILANSTIQTIFNNLLFKEPVDKFLEFMKLVIKENYQLSTILAHALYLHPLFTQFFHEIVSNLDINSEKYIHDFQKYWKRNAKYCPFPIIEMISYAEDPGDFLYRSFLDNFCKSLRTFQAAPLIPNFEYPSYEKLSKEFKKISGSLWSQLISEKDDSTLLFSSQDIEYYIPDYETSLILSPFDIDVIISMCSPNLDIKNPFPTDAFTAYAFSIPQQRSCCHSDSGKINDTSFPNDIEGRLREILINIDNLLIMTDMNCPSQKLLFPIYSKTASPQESELKIYNFLNDQLIMMPNKTLLKLKLTQLNEMMKESYCKWRITAESTSDDFDDVDFFNNVLSDGFSSRENVRKNCLADISHMNQIIFRLENILKQISEEKIDQKKVLTFSLIDHWSQTFKPPITDAEWIKYYTNDKEYQSFFQSCFDNCQKWCQENLYKLNKVDIIECLFNNVMSLFTFKKFVELSEMFKIEDEENAQKVRRVLQDGSIDFIPMTNKLLGDDVQKKLEPMVKVLQKVDSVDQPLIKIDLMLQAQSMLTNLLQFMGIAEVGADQLEPCLFMLYSLANLPHLYSTVQYISHFTIPLRTFERFPLASFERVKSSILGFKKLIEEKSK